MSDDAGSVFAALVDDQLEEERSRKASFEARGLAVITTSAALVSLLFGFSGLVSRSESFELGGAAKGFLIASAVLFVLAALGGLSSNWPLKYQQIEIDHLRILTSDQHWSGEETVARRRVAEAKVEILSRARLLNRRKGTLLLVGISMEVLAVVSLAASVIIMVFDGSVGA